MVVSILLYGCTTQTPTKRTEKNPDGNSTRMLRAISNKSWQQHLTKQLMNCQLLPILKTIQLDERDMRMRKEELISGVFPWNPSHGCARVRRPARTYLQQFCTDTGCSLEDLPEAMDDRDRWRKRVREIRASNMTGWWWWLWLCYRFIEWLLIRDVILKMFENEKGSSFKTK